MADGVDIKAVTAWSLYGSFGWNRLLTHVPGDYESGVFDISSGVPEATPLVHYVKTLNEDPAYIHPAQSEKGWWHQEDRFIDNYASEELAVEVDEKDCLKR
jgi:dTDP-4-dehydrorhamnose reductase